MNILVIQENGRNNENRAFRECFSLQRSFKKLNHAADVWGLGHENFDAIPDWESYDLILNLENYDSTGWVPNLSWTKKPIKFLWSIDAHCVGMAPFLKTYYEGKYDLVLQSTKDFVNEFSTWLPNCYDNTMIEPSSEKNTFIGFCGSMLNRKQLLDFLTNKYSLKQDIMVLGQEMVRAVSSYHIHFNLNLANDINYRSFETLGCNTMLLTNYNPQYEELGFKDGVNCMMYKDFKEMCEKIEVCQNDTEKVKNISNAGHELAKNHTFDKRAEQIISLLSEKK